MCSLPASSGSMTHAVTSTPFATWIRNAKGIRKQGLHVTGRYRLGRRCRNTYSCWPGRAGLKDISHALHADDALRLVGTNEYTALVDQSLAGSNKYFKRILAAQSGFNT